MVRDNALSTAPGNDSSGSPQSAGLSAARTDGAAAGVAVGNGARGGPGQSGDDFPRTTPTSPSADQESAIGQLGSRGGVVCLFYWAISDSADATVAPVIYSERGFGLTAEH